MKSPPPRSLWLAALFCAACASASFACSTAAPRQVTLLVVGPTRGQLDDSVGAGVRVAGFARLHRALAEERRGAHSPVFALSVGDTLYGSGPAAWSRGEVVIAPFAALGVDVCAAGPHDRAYGAERLNDLFARLPCAVMSGGDQALLPAATLTRGGVRVSFVFLDARSSAAPVLPARGALLDDVAAVRAAHTLRAVRAAERPDLIVALTDLAPDEARRLARAVRGFDVIVAGVGAAHVEREAGALVIAPGERAGSVNRLQLTLHEADGAVRLEDRSPLASASASAEDPTVRALIEQALAPYRERANAAIAHSDAALPARDQAGRATFDFIADALREQAHADAAVIALSDAAALPRGTITEAELWNSVPFEAALTRQRIEGSVLRASMNAWLASGAALSGVRVRPETGAIEVGGRSIRDGAGYWVVAPGITLARGGSPNELTVHDALDRYLHDHPFLRARRDGHIVADSLPSYVQCKDQLSQRTASDAR